MKFNLKLFVLVGVLAGFRDVCGTEKENKDYDGFIVEGFGENDEKKELEAAVRGKRVIKAVYKTEKDGGNVELINSNFQKQLSSILVWDGKQVKNVKEEVKKGDYGILYYYMQVNVKYTVYFIFNNGNVDSTASMFRWCERLIRADFRCFNTSNVTDMSYMFQGCTALTKLDLSSFNTINVENMSCMFYECSALKELDLSAFNTEKVENMANMFYKCTSLTKLDLSNFKTSNVTDMSCMFLGCSSLTKLNLSNFNTSKVTNMSGMFYNCTALKNLNLRNFYFSPVCSMNGILDDCNFGNLCLPQTYAKTRKRCWCCCCRYVYLKGKVVASLNQNNVEFEVVQDDLIGS